MDERKLNKVVRDVKKILVLAKSAHDHLESCKISKTKRELKRIIGFDADEITRLHGEDEGMAHQLLYECGVVLKDAKKALRDLDSTELFDEAKELIDEIVSFEGHELIELEKEEHKENELYEYWHSHFYNGIFYHGTNGVAISLIQKRGLVPGWVPWDKYDIKRLHTLLIKSGYQYGVGVYYMNRTLGKEKKAGIFLTTRKKSATSYAERAPEMWSEFVHAHTWTTHNKRDAEAILYSKLMDAEATRKRINLRIEDILAMKKKELNLQLASLCPLKKSEINEIFRIFNKYWNLFSSFNPAIVKISARAPAIFKSVLEYGNYNFFRAMLLDWVKSFERKTTEDIIKKAEFLLRDKHDFKVMQRIPPKYIEVEYI